MCVWTTTGMASPNDPSPTNNDDTNDTTNNNSWSFSSILDRVYDFSHQQRVDRLKECLELERLLQQRREATKAEELEQHERAKTTGELMRRKIIRFYQWDVNNNNNNASSPPKTAVPPNNNNNNNNNNDNNNNTANNEIQSTTKPFVDDDPAKHIHMIWGCRAMALACGHELLVVRGCVHEQHHFKPRQGAHGPKIMRLPIPDYGNTPKRQPQNQQHEEETQDDNGNSSERYVDPCLSVQQALSKCVTQNIMRLEKNVVKRRKQQESTKHQTVKEDATTSSW